MMTSTFLGAGLRQTSSLIVRECDEGVLVFDEKTGRTSLLNHKGALVLNALCGKPQIDETALRIASGMTKDSDIEEFQGLISSLENSGLVARC